ncbi:hypothetical protein BC351_05655 [Paenibacillus ferrarius]|uniref:Uncharacterized protein n=1 Tax=Paenibacillus ferrarius TaxID=1469647 RepID=A0A1V4HFK4_9BACL|nr:hypothetical protein BC351_05655 [Paenibacillus ferrarius]
MQKIAKFMAFIRPRERLKFAKVRASAKCVTILFGKPAIVHLFTLEITLFGKIPAFLHAFESFS